MAALDDASGGFNAFIAAYVREKLKAALSPRAQEQPLR
jgi:hypothetical protein